MKSQLHHTAGMRGHIFSTHLHVPGCRFVKLKVKKKFNKVSVESTFLSFSMTPSSTVEGRFKETFFPNRVHGGHTALWTSCCSKPACASLDRVACCRKREVPAAKCWLG